MHITHIWHKFNLYRTKIIGFVLISILLSSNLLYGQRRVDINNPNYDNRFLSYGFLIGLHIGSYKLKYSEEFLNIDTLHSIQPKSSPGFSLGFIINMHLADYLDVKILPNVAFYEYELDYIYTNSSKNVQFIESTMIEFPLMAKYSSVRRGNLKMYLMGGVKLGVATSKHNLEDDESDLLSIQGTDLSLDFGVGFDIYYPLFKFSPELRFSRGIKNMLGDQPNELSKGIKMLNTNTITLYFLFQ